MHARSADASAPAFVVVAVVAAPDEQPASRRVVMVRASRVRMVISDRGGRAPTAAARVRLAAAVGARPPRSEITMRTLLALTITTLLLAGCSSGAATTATTTKAGADASADLACIHYSNVTQ